MIVLLLVAVMEGVVLLVGSHIRKAGLGPSYYHYANIINMV